MMTQTVGGKGCGKGRTRTVNFGPEKTTSACIPHPKVIRDMGCSR